MSLQLGYWGFVCCGLISFSSCKLHNLFPVLIPESNVRMLSSSLTLLTSLSLKGKENKKKVAYYGLFVAQQLALIFFLEDLQTVLLRSQFWGFVKPQFLLCSKLTYVTSLRGNFLPPEQTSFDPIYLEWRWSKLQRGDPLPPNHSQISVMSRWRLSMPSSKSTQNPLPASF